MAVRRCNKRRCASILAEGLGRSTVAHFACKVRGTDIVAAKYG